MIAALFVEAGGIYAGRGDVDVWDVARDARRYVGPHAVIAHPPCGAWGAFARSRMTMRGLGDDDGCFASALDSVRRFGGVLEHPAWSSAWLTHGLTAPLSRGWHAADFNGGWTCSVEQGSYGHRAHKPTWLYAVRCELPSLCWGRSSASHELEKMSRAERMATPPAFAEVLLAMARGVR
jgi:hypothetical protein